MERLEHDTSRRDTIIDDSVKQSLALFELKGDLFVRLSPHVQRAVMSAAPLLLDLLERVYTDSAALSGFGNRVFGACAICMDNQHTMETGCSCRVIEPLMHVIYATLPEPVTPEPEPEVEAIP